MTPDPTPSPLDAELHPEELIRPVAHLRLKAFALLALHHADDEDASVRNEWELPNADT